ncbi:unnamed protein product [Aphanomyces euteiches]
MRTSCVFGAALACVAAAAGSTSDEVKTFRTCRQTKYVTANNQIFAVDPANETAQTPIQIKGVQWMGMETTDGIPNGLWGKGLVQVQSGINGTSLADMLKFMYANKINVVRLPLTASNIMDDIFPKVKNIHGENKEIALYDKGFTPRMSDFLARFIGSFQKYRIGVVLDIHVLLPRFAQDAYWYYPSYTAVEDTDAYKTAVILAKNYCKVDYWNVIGIEIKNGMTDVTWPSAAGGNNNTDWATAADAIAAKINELCPQWLVFVSGGSNSKNGFVVDTASYPLWPGMNFANATKRPLKAKNVVYSPQAFTQGTQPYGYYFNPKSNCSTVPLTDKNTECVVIINGTKVRNTYDALRCPNSNLQCQSYTPLATTDLAKTYQRLLDENLGDVVRAQKVPVVFGSFGGVYGVDQPLQSSVLDLIIKYISTSTAGGFFASLNPDTEMWLEAPPAGNKTIGKTHYGLMSIRSWQVANADLLAAMSAMKSSEIPCYGDAYPGNPDATNGAESTSAMLAVVTTMLLALFA